MKIKNIIKNLNLTPQQLEAPPGDTIFTLKGCEDFEKQSIWAKYRIVKINEDFYNIERITNVGCFGLPLWIGGKGFFHSDFFWKEGVSPFEPDGKKYKTYEEALDVVNECIKWLYDLELKRDTETKIDYSKREILSTHP